MNGKETAEQKESEEQKARKRILIDRLEVSGLMIQLGFLPIRIPSFTLKDIGKDSNGASAEEVRDTIWNQIKDKFMNVGGALGSAVGSATEGVTNLIKGAGEALKVDNVKDLGKNLTGGAADAGKAVTEGVKDAGKAVGEGAKDALKKVGNLFGK